MGYRAPLGAQARGNQASVGLRIGQVDALALKYGLRQHLRHGLRVWGVGDLLKLQSHAGDAGEEGLQAQVVTAGSAFGGFAQ